MDIKEFDSKYGDKGYSFAKPISVPPSSKSILLDSGSLGLNIAHGTGGIKTGGLIRIMGQPGLGKSSLSARIMASGLAKGMSAMVIDTEGGINLNIIKDTLEDYGLDPDGDLPFRYVEASNMREVNKTSKPIMTFQRAIPMIEEWIVSKEISPNGAVVVIDSLDFLVPEQIVGGDVDQASVAVVARMMKNWLRKFMGTIRGTGSLIIVVSQVSSKIDAYAIDTETFSGGNALKHASSLDIRLKDVGQVAVQKELTGRKVKGMITKSKQGRPWRTFEYEIRGDVGPDRYLETVDIATALGIIEGKTWAVIPATHNGSVKMNGREAIRKYFMEYPEEREFVETLIYDKLKGGDDTNIAPPMPEEEIEHE